MTDRKILIISTIFLFLTMNVHSQKDSTNRIKNEIVLYGGFNQGFLKDPIFSNLNYSENGYLVGSQYRQYKPNGKAILETNLSFSQGKLKTSYSDYFTSSYIFGNISIAYLRKVVNIKNNKIRGFLGVKYKTQFQHSDWNKLSSYSFLATHGILLQSTFFYDIKPRHLIETSISIPFFQLMARPPYNGIDEFIIANNDKVLKLIFTGKPNTINKYFEINWSAGYKFKIKNRLYLNINYTLNYHKVFDTNVFIQLQNQITTGVNLKF